MHVMRMYNIDFSLVHNVVLKVEFIYIVEINNRAVVNYGSVVKGLEVTYIEVPV